MPWIDGEAKCFSGLSSTTNTLGRCKRPYKPKSLKSKQPPTKKKKKTNRHTLSAPLGGMEGTSGQPAKHTKHPLHRSQDGLGSYRLMYYMRDCQNRGLALGSHYHAAAYYVANPSGNQRFDTPPHEPNMRLTWQEC